MIAYHNLDSVFGKNLQNNGFGGMIMKKLIAIVLVAALAVAMVSGCESKDTGNAGQTATDTGTAEAAAPSIPKLVGKDISTQNIKIAYSPISTTAIVAEVSQMAADDIMLKYGNVDIVFFDAGFDSATQITIISECIAQGYDAIIMECTDPVALNPAIQEAEEAGMVVITTNQGCSAIHSAYLMNSSYDAGWIAGQLMDSDLGGVGDVILLDCPAAHVAATLHGRGFQDYIAQNTQFNMIDYANIDNYSQENAYTTMRDMLTKHDKIDAVYAMGDDMAIGVIQAIESAGRTGEGILVYGSEGMPNAIEAIRAGTMRATVWGDRYTMLFTAFCIALLYTDAGMNGYKLGFTETPSVATAFKPITQENVDIMVPYIRYSSLWG